MFLFIEEDNLNTPIVTLTPIVLLNRNNRPNLLSETIKFPSLNISTEPIDNI